MKSTVIEKTEKIRKVTGDTALKTREAVTEIIHLNSRLLNETLESNTLLMEGIREQLLKSEQGSFLNALNTPFAKASALSVETIDHVLENHNQQILSFIRQNTLMVDSIREYSELLVNDNWMEQAMKLIQDNFEACVNTMNATTRNILESYNAHTQLADKIQTRFGEIFTTQVRTFQDVQNTHIDVLTEWASEWWKETQF